MKIKGGLGAHIGLISLIFSIRDLKGGIVGDLHFWRKENRKNNICLTKSRLSPHDIPLCIDTREFTDLFKTGNRFLLAPEPA